MTCVLKVFGGKVCTKVDSEYYQALMKTPFGQSDYWGNNFNDMGSAMVSLHYFKHLLMAIINAKRRSHVVVCQMTLFALIVVNNWFEIVDGMVAVPIAILIQ